MQEDAVKKQQQQSKTTKKNQNSGLIRASPKLDFLADVTFKIPLFVIFHLDIIKQFHYGKMKYTSFDLNVLIFQMI